MAPPLEQNVVISIVLSNYMSGCIAAIKLVQSETAATTVSPEGREWSAAIRDSMHDLMYSAMRDELKQNEFIDAVVHALNAVDNAWKSHLAMWRLFLVSQIDGTPRWSKIRIPLTERFAAMSKIMQYMQRRAFADVSFWDREKIPTNHEHVPAATQGALFEGDRRKTVLDHIASCEKAVSATFYATKAAMEAVLEHYTPASVRIVRLAWLAGLLLPLLVHLINRKMGNVSKSSAQTK